MTAQQAKNALGDKIKILGTPVNTVLLIMLIGICKIGFSGIYDLIVSYGTRIDAVEKKQAVDEASINGNTTNIVVLITHDLNNEKDIASLKAQWDAKFNH